MRPPDGDAASTLSASGAAGASGPAAATDGAGRSVRDMGDVPNPGRDQQGRDDQGHARHPEHHRGLAGDRRGDPADGRSDHEAAHLGGPVVPERLALALGRVRVHEIAPGSGVVDGGAQARERPERDERDGPDDQQRQDGDACRQHQPDHHHPLARGPVRHPPEDRLPHQPGRRPGGHDDAERGQVDAVPGEVDREDRQERTEAEPDGALGDEERQDRAPAVEPGVETVRHEVTCMRRIREPQS